jgi:hypothetical protein
MLKDTNFDACLQHSVQYNTTQLIDYFSRLIDLRMFHFLSTCSYSFSQFIKALFHSLVHP